MALSPCTTSVNDQDQELVSHGTLSFPVACYYDDLTTQDVPWHWHDELEAFLVTKGQAQVTIGSEKYTVNKGDGIFTNAGILHGATKSAAGPCRFHSVVFHPRLIGGSADSIFWQNYLTPLLANQSLEGAHLTPSNRWHQEALHAIEHAWEACVNETPGYEFETRKFLSQLIYLLNSHRPTDTAAPSAKVLRDKERIKVMLRYIKAHYPQDIGSAQIAASAAISVSECLRCFHSTIGITPLQYVKQLRIQKAAELLQTSPLKIVDVGAECGFQEMSYFAKTFKEMRGCTPSEYRKRFAGRI